jgi:3-hydroxyacyl-CoA dehydrogenase
VANRIGTHAFGVALEAMAEAGLKIEEVDKIVGVPMGRPKTAVFGLADLVGIDTMLHVLQTCYDALPDDEDRDAFTAPDWMRKMVEAGKTGRKAKAGFFKKVGKDLLVIDPATLEYREQVKVRFDSIGATRKIDNPAERLAAYVYADDAAGQFAWKTLARSLCYTARRVGEIADDIVNIDRAMRWGFNWDLGPFEAWDAIGVRQSVERMHRDGLDVPAWVNEMVESGEESFYSGPEAEKRYFDVAGGKPVALPHDPHQIRLAALHDNKKLVIKENLGASLVDLGDGCLCLEVHTKMNTIDDDVVAMLGEAVDEAEKNFEALVLGNDGEHFGAGADVMVVVMAAKQKQWDKMDGIVKALQDAIQRARYARVPVVAAPFGYTFGGCAEIAMGANAMQAHAETYIGQVEVGMGLIPAGGGCLRLVERWTGDVAKVANLDLLHLLADPFMSIATARVAAGAEEGKRHRFLLPSDGITLNRDHLLHHAKQRALGMARAGYRPSRPRLLRAAGIDTAKTLGLQAWGMAQAGWATEYEAHLAKKIAHVLCGGNVAANTEVDERHYLELEREAFVSLCGEEKTQERIEHFLTKGKPLRN